MKIYRGLHTLKPSEQGLSLTIGNFDGVHLGHQRIVEQVVAEGRRLGCESGVMVFEPQPREFFSPEAAPPRLMSLRAKLEALSDLGVSQVLCMPFNERFRSLTADEFVARVLVSGLAVRHLVIGDDFRFGCDRRGNFSLLQEQGQQQGFTVVQTETLLMNEERVSSTRIRQALAGGHIKAAERLLGRPYELAGRVAHGEKLGRKLGFPTANIPLMPKPAVDGVWAVEVHSVKYGRLEGVANIGSRPTVNGRDTRLEVHVFDFDENLYGQRLRVRLLEKIRDEQRFDGVHALQNQLSRDAARAREILLSRSANDIR